MHCSDSPKSGSLEGALAANSATPRPNARGRDATESLPSREIKSGLVGYGHADKAQVQEMVRIMLELKKRPSPDDCADALAAALIHAMTPDVAG